MHGYETYKTNDIETASQVKLVVMLYSGAIRFSNLAIEGIEHSDFEKANNNIIKAQNIVSELLASLNHDAGSIAKELSRLYVYIHHLLVEGNIQKNLEPIKESVELLENLKSGWDELLKVEYSKNQQTNINISG